MAEMCGMAYYRNANTVPCTYIKDHPMPRHSWEALKLQDEVDRAKHTFSLQGLPQDVEALLSNIERGNADAYLEVILAVTHSRKRALRNVPGFGGNHE